MRTQLFTSLAAAIALAGAPAAIHADTVKPVAAQHQATASAPCTPAPTGDADRDRYAARDCADGKAQQFEGGAKVVFAISGAALVLVIIILILVL